MTIEQQLVAQLRGALQAFEKMPLIAQASAAPGILWRIWGLLDLLTRERPPDGEKGIEQKADW